MFEIVHTTIFPVMLVILIQSVHSFDIIHSRVFSKLSNIFLITQSEEL